MTRVPWVITAQVLQRLKGYNVIDQVTNPINNSDAGDSKNGCNLQSLGNQEIDHGIR